ncbi:hypothetical protein [Tautonia marina]|uniref:hypothetical protein n=1 Tax=Tautonia marina TaxID=2653855 RepID=UPI001260BD1B|nr:hypothetical protein [Tautonia marina]
MGNAFLNPKHWIYVLCHLLLIVIGFAVYGISSNGLFIGIGGSLVATGFAGWIIFVYVLISEDVSERLRILTEFGFSNAFEGRSVRIRDQYDQRLKNAREKIDIIGFGLSAFREDFGNEFESWKHRTSVRILLIDPEFPSPDSNYADQRDKEEMNSDGKIAADVKRFVSAVSPLIRKSGPKKFEIRFYRCLPTLNILRIDDELFWGPYLIKEQSRNCPTFLVKRGGILYDKFVSQFEQIWASDEWSRAIPPEWLSADK